jgi:hypothetical protein
MQNTFRRGLVAGTVVAVVAALVGASALAARGHGKLGPRASIQFGADDGFGPFFGMGGFAGPGFGHHGFGGPGMGMRGFGMHGFGPGFGHGPRGGHGGAGLLAGEVLKTAASYLGISLADLQADLKGGKTLAQEATAKGKTADGLIKALTDAAKANLDAAVAAGWLTQAQADSVLEMAKRAITHLVNDGPGVPPGARTGPLQAAATYLGMTVSELRDALESGKSLAQVAGDKGKSVDGLVTALTAEAKKKLDAAVADERITQAQADAILKRLTDHVTKQVNREPRAKPSASSTTTNSIKHALRFAVRL